MYPFIRMFYQLFRHRNDGPLGVGETHVSHHLCLPWDLDLWNELNNGRTLTLYDMGRIPMSGRMGVTGVLRRNRWGMAVAGASVRYRKRVKGFDRITMRSRLICWDARFFYMEQSMWNSRGDCTSHALYRAALTDRNGLVPPERMVEELSPGAISPTMPDWVANWIGAEDTRPWPPMQDG